MSLIFAIIACFLAWLFDLSPVYALVVTLSVVGHYVEREIAKLRAAIEELRIPGESIEEMLANLKPVSLSDGEKAKLRAGIRKAHNKRKGGGKCSKE